MRVRSLACALLVICAACVYSASAEGVVELTQGTFDEAITEDTTWFVAFTAPWCGHCKHLKPTWNELAAGADFRVGNVDCTKHVALRERFAVRGFPTILFHRQGTWYKYAGARSVQAFTEFAASGYTNAATVQPAAAAASTTTTTTSSSSSSSEAPVTQEAAVLQRQQGKSHVVSLTDDTFWDTVATGTWLVEFYAPWCGHCKKLEPTWRQLAEDAHDANLGYQVAKVDCVANPRTATHLGVSSYPVVKLIRDGLVFTFAGRRTLEALKDFARPDAKLRQAPVPLQDLLSVGSMRVLTDSNFEALTLDRKVWFVAFLDEDGEDNEALSQELKALADVSSGLFNVAKVFRSTHPQAFLRYDVRTTPQFIMYVGTGYFHYPSNEPMVAESWMEFVGHGGYSVHTPKQRVDVTEVGADKPLSLFNYGPEVWMYLAKKHIGAYVVGLLVMAFMYGAFLVTVVVGSSSTKQQRAPKPYRSGDSVDDDSADKARTKRKKSNGK